MTDRQGALGVLSNGDSAERVRALGAFHSRYAHDQLVIDKWFSTQALSTRDDTFKAVVAMTGHPAFTVETTNRQSAMVGGDRERVVKGNSVAARVKIGGVGDIE